MTAGAHIAHATGQRGRRRRASSLPASTVVNRCVWVAVDSAKNSGYCIGSHECVVHDSGEVRALDHRGLVEIIRRAIAYALHIGLTAKDVVLVLEIPWRGPPRGAKHKARNQHKVVMGLGGASHAWRSAWCEVYETKEPQRCVTVMPQDWRLPVLGVAGGPQIESRERSTAAMWFKESGHEPRELGSDERAAICISRWCQHATAVKLKMRKPRGKRGSS